MCVQGVGTRGHEMRDLRMLSKRTRGPEIRDSGTRDEGLEDVELEAFKSSNYRGGYENVT